MLELPPPAAQAAADLLNVARSTGVIPTPEEHDDMTKRKKTHRVDGRPRTDNRTPTRSFRCPDPVWKLVEQHSKARKITPTDWLRHAIERFSKEEQRQAEYSKKAKGKKKAATATT